MTVAVGITSGAAVLAEASVVVTGVPAVLDNGALAVPLITFGSTEHDRCHDDEDDHDDPDKDDHLLFTLRFTGLRGAAVVICPGSGGVGRTPLGEDGCKMNRSPAGFTGIKAGVTGCGAGVLAAGWGKTTLKGSAGTFSPDLLINRSTNCISRSIGRSFFIMPAGGLGTGAGGTLSGTVIFVPQ